MSVDLRNSGDPVADGTVGLRLEPAWTAGDSKTLYLYRSWRKSKDGSRAKEVRPLGPLPKKGSRSQ